MSSHGRKRSRKSAASAPCEDPRLRVFDFNEDEEEQNLSFFEVRNPRMETVSSENVGEVSGEVQNLMKNFGVRNPSMGTTSSENVGDVSGEVQNLMKNFGADINEAVVAKKQRMEACTEASCKAGDQEIKRVFKTEEEKMQMLHTEHGQQFQALFQQLDSGMLEFQAQQENITDLDELEKKIMNQLTDSLNGLKESLSMLPK